MRPVGGMKVKLETEDGIENILPGYSGYGSNLL